MFIFVRHGESETNIFLHKGHPNAEEEIHKNGDPDLTAMGLAQAANTSAHLQQVLATMEMPRIRVMQSVFTRALQTGHPFTREYPNIDSVTDSVDLLEYTPAKKALTDVHLDRGICHDTWETFRDRVVTFYDTHMVSGTRQVDAPVVIFGHSVFISCLLTYVGTQGTFFPDSDQLAIRLPNCSISTVAWSNDREQWVIDAVGSIAHLTSELVTGTHNDFATKQ